MKALLGGLCCFVREVVRMAKDFAPAYRAWFGKRISKSPLKQGLLNRPGVGVHGKVLLRVMSGVLIWGFALGVLFVFVLFPLDVFTGKVIFLLFPILALALVPVLKYQSDLYFLGYLGERAVGEELEKLGRPQWRIFHSVFIKYGDIDHVIVCPQGVFCVETKTLRVFPQKKAELIFKNGTLWRDEKPLNNPDPIRQARRNAAQLHEYLKENNCQPGFIQCIIAFPSYDVKIEHGHYDKDIVPCNPKTIGSIFAKRDDKLSAQQMYGICAALEKKTRDEIKDAP